jgi:hypothetical protein
VQWPERFIDFFLGGFICESRVREKKKQKTKNKKQKKKPSVKEGMDMTRASLLDRNFSSSVSHMCGFCGRLYGSVALKKGRDWGGGAQWGAPSQTDRTSPRTFFFFFFFFFSFPVLFFFISSSSCASGFPPSSSYLSI